jgi:hypothetical protein
MIDERCGEKMAGRSFWGCREMVNSANIDDAVSSYVIWIFQAILLTSTVR